MSPHEHHGRKGPPRKGPPRPHHPHPRHVPSSASTAFVDQGRVDALLAPWVPDASARAFVVRCVLGEGPAHHRGANFVLLALLGLLVERHGAVAHTDDPNDAQRVAVPLRLPPHLADDQEDAAYPLTLPTRALERLAPRGSRELDAMVDCLTDGPPQHALANAAMVALLDALLARSEG